MKTRCAWAEKSADLDKKYHDEEWGVPIYDDRLLFELLTLEGAQAGLSWTTILAKRENYREAFNHFTVEVIAGYDDKKIASLLNNSGIVRNRLKIYSVVTNAKAFLEIQAEYGSFSDYIWGFVGGKPIQNTWVTVADVPVSTNISDTMSKSLKKKGFKFVGTTICYAYMQAAGMVNDHTVDCFRHKKAKMYGH